MGEVLLSEAEKTFLTHGIQENLRSDGRECLDYRHMELETDVISNCSGSAHARLANTDILVGVKAELGTPNPDKPNQGRLEFFVDCTANANPEFEGRGGEEIAAEISQFLTLSFANCLDLQSLCVVPWQQCWVLFVDILILECGGTLMDAASVAVKAALFDTKIPAVTVTQNEEGQMEMDISDDPYDVKQLVISRVPCVVTLFRVGHQFIVDATQEEEACSLGKLLLAITETGTIVGTRKTGSGSLHPESVVDVLETAQEIGMNLNKELMKKLKHSSKLKKGRRGFL